MIHKSVYTMWNTFHHVITNEKTIISIFCLILCAHGIKELQIKGGLMGVTDRNCNSISVSMTCYTGIFQQQMRVAKRLHDSSDQ